jgi:2',3'-cyclic-nucleotide 2'-phosphodiesterase (5'-nucleotidase family)
MIAADNPAPAHPGLMRVFRAPHNPHGALDALYLIAGDAREARIERLETSGDPLPGPGTGIRHLRIFHFNDLHNALQAHDLHGKPAPLFSRIVKRYRDARAAAGLDDIVLLLSGGDDHTGTPFDELLGWAPDEFVLDPAYVAYSAAGVDAAALGNHDLDRGSALRALGIENDATFPVLSANLAGTRALVPGRHYFAGAILVAKGLRIGMIGLTTPVDTRVGTPSDPMLEVASPLATLANLLPIVASRADVTIVMSHCGYGVDSHDAPAAFGTGYLAEGDVAIARLAAKLTERPVLVLGAHSHTALNNDGFGPHSLIDGVPIVQAGGNGSHVGEFSATLVLDSTRAHWAFDARLHALTGSPRGAAAGAIASASQVAPAGPIAPAGAATPTSTPASGADVAGEADIEFEARVIAPLVARVRERTEEVLATTDRDESLSRATTLVQRYTCENALLNFICDALVERSAEFPHGPVELAMVNSTAIADGLPAAGTITFADWYRVQPFADTLQIGTLSAAELIAILASNAQRVVRPEELIGPGAIDLRGYVSRGFLHFSKALRYTLRLGTSARDASTGDAELGGRALAGDPRRTIRVAFTNYLGAGGYAESWNGNPIGAGVQGCLPGYDLRDIPRHDTGLVFRNEVIAHIRLVGHVGASSGARIDGRLSVA